MAISDKLTYLNETKSQLKDMINYGLPSEEQITSSTTFRNYVSSIFNAFLETLRTPDTLFTNLPKKSGTGAVISLNDTANAPMRIELGATELTQAGTPTPDSPQDIHTISGSNTIKVRGKNLTNIPDGSATMNNQYYKDVATNIVITSGMVGKKISYSYDINITSITTTSTAVSGVIGRGPSSLEMTNQIKTATYSPTTGSHSIKIENVEILEAWVGQYLIIRFIGFGAPSTCSYEYSNVQIEYGETASNFEPYISQVAEVDLSSKNLFDINDFESKIKASFTTSIRNSEINIKRSSATQYLYPLNCKANTQYTINLKVKNTNSDFYVLLIYSDNTNTRIAGETALNDYTEITITSTANKTITSLRIDEYGWSNDLYLKDIMLNEGTTALPYEEYYSYGEYCKIGTYEDKFIRTSGKNLFNPVNNVWGKYNVWQNNTGNFTDAFTNTFEVKGGETCSIKFECIERTMRTSYQFLDDNNNYLSGVYYSIGVKEKIYENISIPATATKCILCQLDGKQTDNIKVQFEYSPNCTDYEPYGSNEWYIKKNIGKVDLGTLSYNYNASYGFNSSDINTNVVKPANNNTTANILCTCYVKATANQCYALEGSITSGISINNGGSIVIRETGYSDTTTYKTAMSGNYLYYQLATPTYTQITGTLETQLENIYKNMLSQKGTTNISQINNDLGFVLDVEAVEE